VVLGGGSGSIDGTIGRNLWLGMGTATLAAKVAGDAAIASESISVADTAKIAGAVRYTSSAPNPALEAIATTAVYTPPTPEQRPDPLATALAWLLRTALVLAGFALLAWLIMRLAPRLLTGPASVLAAQPPAGQSEFKPLSEVPPSEQLPGGAFVVVAYVAVSHGIWMKLTSRVDYTNQQIVDIKKRLDSLPPPTN